MGIADPLSAHWTATPAPVPLPGAEHHWLLTPLCDTTGVTDMTGLPADVRDAFWDALADVVRDVPGYSFAVQPGEVIVHVVAGGKATFEFKPAPTCQENAPSMVRMGAFVDSHTHECVREAGHRSVVHRCGCGVEWHEAGERSGGDPPA